MDYNSESYTTLWLATATLLKGSTEYPVSRKPCFKDKAEVNTFTASVGNQFTEKQQLYRTKFSYFAASDFSLPGDLLASGGGNQTQTLARQASALFYLQLPSYNFWHS